MKGQKRKYTCELCGLERKAQAIVIDSIVPREIIKLTHMLGSETLIVLLCINCRYRLEHWYQKTVSTVTYDLGSKQFKPKSPPTMVKEYEAAYAAFVKYNKRLLHLA